MLNELLIANNWQYSGRYWNVFIYVCKYNIAD